jgi:hypothetical protein
LHGWVNTRDTEPARARRLTVKTLRPWAVLFY